MTDTLQQFMIWGLSDGRAGMANQVVGLCERLGALYDYRWDHKIIAPTNLANFWPTMLASSPRVQVKNPEELVGPLPDLMIGCGRKIIPLLLYFRNKGVKTIYLQDPRINPDRFDLVIAPTHDPVTGPNVIKTLGSIHKVTPDRLTNAMPSNHAALLARLAAPRITALIGGDNKYLTLTPSRAAEIAADLKAINAQMGGSLLVTASRRTSEAAQAILKDELTSLGSACFFWDGTGDNPYFDMLRLADYILVTEDSVNMASEAAATGKPIFLLNLDKKRRVGGLLAPKPATKFDDFLAQLKQIGAVNDLPDATVLPNRPYPAFDPATAALPAINQLIDQV